MQCFVAAASVVPVINTQMRKPWRCGSAENVRVRPVLPVKGPANSRDSAILSFIRMSGLIPRGLPRLIESKALEHLVLNQTV